MQKKLFLNAASRSIFILHLAAERWKLWILVPFCLVFSSCVSQRAAPPRVAFFYGTPVPVESLSRYKQVVVEAENIADLAQFWKHGVEVFAYVSVGEAESWRASARNLPDTLFFQKNAAWNSRVADLTQQRWRDYLIDERMASLWQAGYHGFFLDTLDSYRLAAHTPAQQETQQRALIELIRAIHGRYPGAKLLLNRGFEVLPEVASYAHGVVAESLFRSWNPISQMYVPVSDADQHWLLERLIQVRDKYKLPVTVIDYVSPSQPLLALETACRIRKLGFAAWVANPGLDTILSEGTQ